MGMRNLLMFIGLCLAACVPLVGHAQPAAPTIRVAPLYTPDSSMRFAAGDLALLPPDVQPYIRYLSLYNVPAAQRPEYARTVSFVLNSLSKRKKMYIPVFVGASDQTVIRVNLQDYEIDPKVWDQLGRQGSGPKPFPEPYFHANVEKQDHEIVDRVTRTTKQVPTGYYVRDAYGQVVPQYRTEYVNVVEKVPSGHVRRSYQLMSAPWVDPPTAQVLCAGTRSDFPMFRADWFIVNATVEPAYHLFLGFGDNIKDFENLVFANEDLAKKAKSQMKGVVVKSSVARNNRTLTRSPTFTGGYYWISHDTLKSIDDRNYVQNILDEKFDATEVIATLPNGLQAYFVGDDKGKRLDKADNEIATDHMLADKIVRNGRSCIYCHAPGINPIQDEVRTLNTKLQNRSSVELRILKEKDKYRIEDLFSGNLDRQIVRDQQLYADAVGEATGMPPVQMARVYFDQWEGYTELLLNKDTIARECGMTVADVDRYAVVSNDPLILGLTKDPIRPVRRDQWERSYQNFMVDVIRARGAAPQAPHKPK